MKWKNLLAFPLTLGLVSILSVSVLALDTSISDVALESNSDTQPVAVIDISESQSNSLTEGTVEQNAPSETLGGEADQEKPEGNVPPEALDGEVEQEKPEENVPSETPNGESGVDVIPEENPSQMLPDANASQENAMVPDGWQQVNGNWYYYRNGEALKGSQTVPIDKTNTDLGATDWYFFDETGAMQTGPIPMFGGYQAYQDDGRLLHSGWELIGGKYYYAQPNQQLSLGSVYIPVREDTSISDWYYITVENGMRVGSVPIYGGYQCYYESGRLVYGGWATVNGKTYYADPSNQQLKTGTAVIDNVTYIFDSTGMLISEVHKGIDVSSHQGIIDWNQVRTSGVQFAVIRIMSWQGDAATGGYAIDPDFERNIREARAAGIYVGAYWYSVAFNGSEALQEVNIIKNSVAWNNVLNDGIILDLPMFIDYENNTAWFNSQTTYASRTEAVRMGMIYTENILGCRPGFYSSESYIENWFDGKQLIAEGYDCWVANWSGSHGLGDDAAMWQYTSKGSVSGINGNVDLNYCYNSDYFDSLKVYDQGIGKNVQGNAQTILTRVVQNEVGGMNNTEVYKAQAVAANTYMRYLIGQGKIPSAHFKIMKVNEL